MLVLTRRLDETIVLPAIHTTIRVVSIKPGMVRLGIEAPPEVAVVRAEIMDRTRTPAPRTDAEAACPAQPLNHLLRDRLNAAVIGLGLARRQLQLGLIRESETVLDKISHEIAALRAQVDSEGQPTPVPLPPQLCRSERFQDNRP